MSDAVLDDLWSALGGDPAALAFARPEGDGPALPSSFDVTAMARAAIGATGLAAGEAWFARTGRRQRVAVDGRHATAEFRSERLLAIDGAGPGPLWDPIAGLYATRDGRRVRLHTNFEHHRDAVTGVLACRTDRDDVAAALAGRDAFAFEDAAHAAGGAVAAARDFAEWDSHPQAAAVAGEPLAAVTRLGDAPARALPAGDRPLAGLRVLDLSRILAGPVAGRALAAHGATVMRLGTPGLLVIDWAVKDTGRGKLQAHADLDTEEGRAAFRELVAGADIVIDAFRPGALAARGFDAATLAALRPGLVHVALAAWGWSGPWAGRRGFDSLVQTATGLNDAEGRVAGCGLLALPCQALDHGAGYLMAAAAILTRLRQAREGGSWSVRVSLARTGLWLRSLPRVEGGLDVPDPEREDLADLLETAASGFGEMSFVRHAARLSETPAAWTRPAVPLGSHPPAWPEES